MVKIAISELSGGIAREIIDHLLATNEHEILILTRSEPSSPEIIPAGTSWVKVDYGDKKSLVDAVQGVHTVLCFIHAHLDPQGTEQKNLIDACVEAGVKRFAPSEWSVAKPSLFRWYASKQIIRDYLAELNKDKKVLEYSLFQPGMLLNHLAHPYPTSPYLPETPLNIDILNRRALIVDETDTPEDQKIQVVLTSLHDIASIVTRAISLPSPWPVNGGMRGTLITISELLSLAERIRIGGEPFQIERLKVEDLQRGEMKSTWIPISKETMSGSPQLPAPSPEQIKKTTRLILAGSFMGMVQGAYLVGDEWNRLLPGYKFLGVEDFFKQIWGPGGRHEREVQLKLAGRKEGGGEGSVSGDESRSELGGYFRRARREAGLGEVEDEEEDDADTVMGEDSHHEVQVGSMGNSLNLMARGAAAGGVGGVGRGGGRGGQRRPAFDGFVAAGWMFSPGW